MIKACQFVIVRILHTSLKFPAFPAGGGRVTVPPLCPPIVEIFFQGIAYEPPTPPGPNYST